MFKKAFGVLQQVGKALMLPVAILPAAGLLLGLGHANVLGIPLMEQAGGIIFGNLISGTSRNPSLRPQLFTLAILGFALTEALGLFALMMSFLLLFAI